LLSENEKKAVRYLFISWFLYFITIAAPAQQVDSIAFHLYTDSLKKGVYNYINVDGKLSNGRWMPLTQKEITFTSSHGIFEGNDLFIPADFKEEKVQVKAVLKSNPALQKEITIWIKKKPDPEKLPTKKEVMKGRPKNKRR
jgi:hypothetical protein